MISTLTHDDFSKQLNKSFFIKTDEGDLTLELVEVKVLQPAHEKNNRDQFSILFKGDANILLPQQIYHLDQSEMGELSIFLVPIGRESQQDNNKEGAFLYEAIFT